MAVIDSYSEANWNGSSSVYSAAQFAGIGQSFTGDGGQVNTCKFYIAKSGSPTGNVTCVLYAHSGTFGASSVPTGAALATSDAIDISTLSTSETLTEFTFSTPYTTVNGTYYIIAILYNSGDASNYLKVGRDNDSPTHGGNYCALFIGSWGAVSTIDGIFYAITTSSFSPSVSPSTSFSPSISPSISPSYSSSLSPSISPSFSSSQSPSTSISPSKSPSLSPSASPSVSPSTSISPSKSPSKSPSISPSVSPSTSLSPSISTSKSPSLSPSYSPSLSPSKSPSISPSISSSTSPSASSSRSPSISPSLSASSSVSPSVSPSPPAYIGYRVMKIQGRLSNSGFEQKIYLREITSSEADS